jgi:hypothetical protein
MGLKLRVVTLLERNTQVKSQQRELIPGPLSIALRQSDFPKRKAQKDKKNFKYWNYHYFI